MADAITVKSGAPGVGTPEFVAYLLMCGIAREGLSSTSADFTLPVVGARNKEWILDTYEECLHLVKNGYRK